MVRRRSFSLRWCFEYTEFPHMGVPPNHLLCNKKRHIPHTSQLGVDSRWISFITYTSWKKQGLLLGAQETDTADSWSIMLYRRSGQEAVFPPHCSCKMEQTVYTARCAKNMIQANFQDESIILHNFQARKIWTLLTSESEVFLKIEFIKEV